MMFAVLIVVVAVITIIGIIANSHDDVKAIEYPHPM